MAKQETIWTDNEGDECSCERAALYNDLAIAREDEDYGSPLAPDVIAAIDALHEYAHRGDVSVEIPETTTEGPLFRHCGSEPDDDWVKRLERVNGMIDCLLIEPPRPTFDEIKALRVGDEVRISESWFRVSDTPHDRVRVSFVAGITVTPFDIDELATICQGIRRGQ